MRNIEEKLHPIFEFSFILDDRYNSLTVGKNVHFTKQSIGCFKCSFRETKYWLLEMFIS